MKPTHSPNKLEIIISVILTILSLITTITVFHYFIRIYKLSTSSRITIFFVLLIFMISIGQEIFNWVYSSFQKMNK
jgi:hypothetical protein